jgi:4-carboxymuconolactone decarboxylase
MSDEYADEYAEGLANRRAVLGEAHVQRSLDSASEFSGPWQDHITPTVWGRVWGRDGLDRRTRSMLTVALLTALHCGDELALHVRAAITNGVTPAELREVLLHTSVYAGVPAANSAFGIAQRVLAELGVPEATMPYSGPSASSSTEDSPA